MAILKGDFISRFTLDVLHGARQLLYPGHCLLCGHPLVNDESHFCAPCQHAAFDDPHETCPRCAGTVGPYAVHAGRCPACRSEAFAFEGVFRLGLYDGLLREIVLQLKHQRGEGLAELLGECWAERARTHFLAQSFDLIVPVPLHWLRRWKRGYNQSAALARGLSLGLSVPCHTRCLRRIRNTPHQASLTPAGRKANVRGAFSTRLVSSVKGRAVLLVDDVMTTGATVNEAARSLREAGASRVAVAVLTRAQG